MNLPIYNQNENCEKCGNEHFVEKYNPGVGMNCIKRECLRCSNIQFRSALDSLASQDTVNTVNTVNTVKEESKMNNNIIRDKVNSKFVELLKDGRSHFTQDEIKKLRDEIFDFLSNSIFR